MKLIGTVRDIAALGGVHDVELHGDYALVGGKGRAGNRTPPHEPGSMGIVDIRDPEHPRVVARFPLPPREGGRWIQAETVLPAGDLGYFAGSCLWTVDLRDPARATIVHELDERCLESVNGMVRRDDFLFTASKKERLCVIDVREARAPRLWGAFTPLGTGFASPHDIALLGREYLVPVNIKEGEPRDRLQVYRIAAAASPVPLPLAEWRLVGALDDPRLLGANRIQVRGSWAYVCCNKGHAVATVDLSDPTRPRLAAHVPIPSGTSGICLVGDRLYTPGFTHLDVWDVAAPERLRLVARVPLGDFEPSHDIACRDGLLYVTDHRQDQLGIVALEGSERPTFA